MSTLFADATLPASYFDDLSVLLVLLRGIVGATLAAHGLNKFFGGGKIPGTAGWFDSMGMKPNGKVHAIVAASTEVGCGVLMVLGLLVPFAAAGYVALMIVAGWTVHRPVGYWSAKNGWEYNSILATVAVLLASVGPGRHSLDWALGVDLSFQPYTAFAISVVLGAVGGIGLLVCCYRPPASDDA